jgi:hypothetical protein
MESRVTHRERKKENEKEKTCILIDMAIPTDRNVIKKGRGKETKIQAFVYRDATHVDHEMYDHIGNNWSHRKSNKKFKKNLEAIPRKHSIDTL